VALRQQSYTTRAAYRLSAHARLATDAAYRETIFDYLSRSSEAVPKCVAAADDFPNPAP